MRAVHRVDVSARPVDRHGVDERHEEPPPVRDEDAGRTDAREERRKRRATSVGATVGRPSFARDPGAIRAWIRCGPGGPERVSRSALLEPVRRCRSSCRSRSRRRARPRRSPRWPRRSPGPPSSRARRCRARHGRGSAGARLPMVARLPSFIRAAPSPSRTTTGRERVEGDARAPSRSRRPSTRPGRGAAAGRRA